MHYLLVPKLVYVRNFTSVEIFDKLNRILGMVCFMTYSVYSLSFASLFPQQSQYIMMITLFFLLFIFWTLVSLAWFVICNHYSTKGEMPKLLNSFCGQLQRIFCCCFPPPKPDDKVDSKKDITANGTMTTNDVNSRCLPCFRRRVQVETIASNNDILGEEAGAAKTEPNYTEDSKKDITANGTMMPNDVNSRCFPCLRRRIQVKTIASNNDILTEETGAAKTEPDDTIASKNDILAEETVAAKTKSNETNDPAKPKCDFCDRCETCQADFDKDKTKGKNKKEIESKCGALNYLVFIIVCILMVISNIALWAVMAG